MSEAGIEAAYPGLESGAMCSDLKYQQTAFLEKQNKERLRIWTLSELFK